MTLDTNADLQAQKTQRANEKDSAAKIDILAKLKSLEGASLAPVYEILTCRPGTPMSVQWRTAFTAIRARGFGSDDIITLAGIRGGVHGRRCNPYPMPEVIAAFKYLLVGIPAERIFPCLKNDREFQLNHAKEYIGR